MKVQQGQRETVLGKIRKYALQQIRSWETLETLVMLALIIYMVIMFTLMRYELNLYSIILFVFFLGLTAFGLYETVPALIMYFRPLSSSAFRMDLSEQEKMRICEEIDAKTLPGERLELPDATLLEKYAVLEGKRNIEVIRWEDMAELTKTEYPFRQKYKGTFILKFIDKQGKKHELDIHNGKTYNPVRQVSTLFIYMMEHHPEIKLELSEIDQERIDQIREENDKIRGKSSIFG